MRWLYENINPFNLPQWGFYKLFPVICSLAISYIIYRYSIAFKSLRPLFLTALYALNPLTFYISAYHGQRESMWLFFIILSIFLFKIKKYIFLAFSFGIGLSIKLPPLLFAPFLFFSIPTIKNKIAFIFIVTIVFFLLSLPEIIFYTENIIKHVLFYQGWEGWWGLSGITTKLDTISGYSVFTDTFKPIQKLLLYTSILGATFYFYKKRTGIIESLLGIILIVFIFSIAYAPQYILWPLPFLILLYKRYKKYFWLYSLISIFVAINNYGTFGIKILEQILLEFPRNYIYYKIPHLLYPMDLYFSLWIFFIFLLIKIIKKPKYAYKKYIKKGSPKKTLSGDRIV